jgi:hypothetical protein
MMDYRDYIPTPDTIFDDHERAERFEASGDWCMECNGPAKLTCQYH